MNLCSVTGQLKVSAQEYTPHDVLIGGALKDENNKAEDLADLLDDDSVDRDIMMIAIQKYSPVQSPEKNDRYV